MPHSFLSLIRCLTVTALAALHLPSSAQTPAPPNTMPRGELDSTILQRFAPLSAVNTPPAPLAPQKPAPQSTANPSSLASQAAPPVSSADAQATAPFDIWDRIRRGFAMPDLDTDLVSEREQWYAKQPEYLLRMSERSRKYMHYIVEEVEKRKMPTELALLPFIESAFNPVALSSAKASGLWQFMPATGKDYALTQTSFRDERRDVMESTRAALDYFQRLYGMFGDWHLALAAYNWGEGNVGKAVARNQAVGLPTRYEDLRMPKETQHYVPKLQAVKNIINDPASFNIRLPIIDNHPYFTAVTIDRDMDVSVAARLAQISVDDFKALNPLFTKPFIIASATPHILLPWDNADLFRQNLETNRSNRLATWTAWVAPRDMRLAEAAKTVGMSESEFRSANPVPARSILKGGSTYMVHRSSDSADVSLQVANKAYVAFAMEVALRKIAVRVQRGDTLKSMADRYGVSSASLIDWNRLKPGVQPKVGQSLTLYVPTRTARSKAASKTTKSRVSSVKVNSKTSAASAPSRAAKKTAASSSSRAKPKTGKPTQKPAQPAKKTSSQKK